MPRAASLTDSSLSIKHCSRMGVVAGELISLIALIARILIFLSRWESIVAKGARHRSSLNSPSITTYLPCSSKVGVCNGVGNSLRAKRLNSRSERLYIDHVEPREERKEYELLHVAFDGEREASNATCNTCIWALASGRWGLLSGCRPLNGKSGA